MSGAQRAFERERVRLAVSEANRRRPAGAPRVRFADWWATHGPAGRAVRRLAAARLAAAAARPAPPAPTSGAFARAVSAVRRVFRIPGRGGRR